MLHWKCWHRITKGSCWKALLNKMLLFFTHRKTNVPWNHILITDPASGYKIDQICGYATEHLQNEQASFCVAKYQSKFINVWTPGLFFHCHLLKTWSLIHIPTIENVLLTMPVCLPVGQIHTYLSGLLSNRLKKCLFPKGSSNVFLTTSKSLVGPELLKPITGCHLQ